MAIGFSIHETYNYIIKRLPITYRNNKISGTWITILVQNYGTEVFKAKY